MCVRALGARRVDWQGWMGRGGGGGSAVGRDMHSGLVCSASSVLGTLAAKHCGAFVCIESRSSHTTISSNPRHSALQVSQKVSFLTRDLLVYAVGIGSSNLRYTYEYHEDFEAFP